MTGQAPPTETSALVMAAKILWREAGLSEDMRAAFSALARQDCPRLVYLDAGPGCGKSHFATEILKRLNLCLQSCGVQLLFLTANHNSKFKWDKPKHGFKNDI